MVKLLSELPVGAKVVDKDTKYNDAPIVWLVGGHNHYAQGQTVLVSEKIITLKSFDAKEVSNSDNNRVKYGNNRYYQSNIRQWLNSDSQSWYSPQHSADAPPTSANTWLTYNSYDTESGFLTNFSEQLKSVLLPTTLTVAKNTITDGGGSESVSDRVFLLSNIEVGLPKENGIEDGKLMPLFSTASNRIAKPTSGAVNNSGYKDDTLKENTVWRYWLRNPYFNSAYNTRVAYTDGSLYYSSAYDSTYGVRPALNLPSDTIVSETVDSNDAYSLIWQLVSPRGDTDLGVITSGSSLLTYTIQNLVIATTVTERVNGITVGTKSVVNGTQYTVSVSDSQWESIKYGKYRNVVGDKNEITLEFSSGEIYTYPFTKALPPNAKTEEVVKAVNDMSNTAMPSHKKKLVDAIGNKATVGGTGTLEDIAKAIESISVESMGGMKTAKGTFTTSMDDRPKVSVRGLAFKPKGILYKSSTGTPCGVYFIKEFYDGKLFSVNMSFDRISSGAISFGTSSFTPVDGGFDAMVGSYTERNTIYDYVVFG